MGNKKPWHLLEQMPGKKQTNDRKVSVRLQSQQPTAEGQKVNPFEGVFLDLIRWFYIPKK